MHKEFVTALPIYRALRERVRRGESVLMYAPRYFGADVILREMRAEWGAEGKRTAFIDLAPLVRSGRLDYGKLWDSLCGQLGNRKSLAVRDLAGFDRAFRAFVDKQEEKVLLLISGDTKGCDAALYELLSIANSVLRDPQGNGLSRLQVLATDAFSLWYRRQGEVESEWRGFDSVRFQFLSKDEILDYVLQVWSKVDGIDNASETLAGELFLLTDGHAGLLLEICAHLAMGGWDQPSNHWRQGIKGVLANAHVIEALRRDLEEDRVALTQTAREYETAGYPAEYGSPRVQLLRQLGILRWLTADQAVLCGGVIRDLVKAIANTEVSKRLGTLYALAGERRYEGGAIEVEADDLCVLHLSDMHVGSDHGFRFKVGTKIFNEGKRSLAETLREDIEAQGLLGKIGGIILSGDIVCNGTDDEFARAKEVLSEIAKALTLPESKIAVVGGNHDIQWNPGPYSMTAPGRNTASREPYQRFVQSLGNRSVESATLTTFEPQSRRVRVRVLAIDSNAVEGPDAAGIGYVSQETFRVADDLISEDEKQSPLDPSVHTATWVVVHHHIMPITSSPLSDARTKKVSILGNAPELLSRAAVWGAELILHGHEHQPWLARVSWWPGEATGGFSEAVVACAGSCGANRERLGPISRNHYFVMLRRPTALIVRSRVFGDEGLQFCAHNDLILDLPAS